MGIHPGSDGSFIHLSFALPHVEDVVFVEGLVGNTLRDKRVDTSKYRSVFHLLSEEYALSPDETLKWLAGLRYNDE
jgi:hypothetical protein